MLSPVAHDRSDGRVASADGRLSRQSVPLLSCQLHELQDLALQLLPTVLCVPG